MYKYKVERDQQQNTILTFHHCSPSLIQKAISSWSSAAGSPRFTSITRKIVSNWAIARIAAGFYCALES